MLVGGQVTAKLIGLLAFAYLARILDPDSYGEVEFVAGLAGLFARSSTSGSAPSE